MSHPNDMLQLPGLLLHFSCQKECTRGNWVSVELCEGVEHVKPVQVDYGRVDA